MRSKIVKSRKIVIKAGTSILSTRAGKISKRNLELLGDGIVDLRRSKKEVVLVTSGSIAFGMKAMRIKKRPASMARLQACAAIGQIRLMQAYDQYFQSRRTHTSQLLLTRDGLEMRKRFLSARHTLEELLSMKVLPIVNENDTVATEEIAFGDNDILSVQVAHLMHADLLVLLSDVDGFYLKDGSRVRDVTSLSEIDNQLVRHLKDSKKEKSVGGMRAKLEAAKVAMKLGIPLLIVNGHDPKALKKALKGEDVGTLFHASGHSKNSRKKWIAYSAARRGTVHLDPGACDALTIKKRSLLASGMTKIEGSFLKGDVVELADPKGKILGRGVVRYSHRELNQILGKKSKDINKILGYKHHDEVVHRNDLVLWS